MGYEIYRLKNVDGDGWFSLYENNDKERFGIQDCKGCIRFFDRNLNSFLIDDETIQWMLPYLQSRVLTGSICNKDTEEKKPE